MPFKGTLSVNYIFSKDKQKNNKPFVEMRIISTNNYFQLQQNFIIKSNWDCFRRFSNQIATIVICYILYVKCFNFIVICMLFQSTGNFYFIRIFKC